MTYKPYSDAVSRTEARILDTYGDAVSVANKKKVLRKFGESVQVQTTNTTLMDNLTGVYNETYVEQNLITHIASSSASDTGVVRIEGHTCGSDVSVTGITQTAGTATATTGAAHGFVVDEWVTIRGANEAGYNGLVKVLSTPLTTTFTYSVASGTASPATGTLLANSYNKTFTVQTVTLAGQTKTALATPLARCSRINVDEQNKATDLVGAVYVAQDVTFTAGVPASGVACMIPAGSNQSRKCSTTMSSSDYLLIEAIHVESAEKTSGRMATCELQIRKAGGVWLPVEDLSISAGNTFDQNMKELVVVPPNADVRIVAKASTNGQDIGATFVGALAN